jgi:sulfatase modifying factor 1
VHMAARFSILCSLLFTTIILLGISSCSNPTEVEEIPPSQMLPAADFVLIPAGSFMMGSPENEPGRSTVEVLHPVQLSHPFWMKSTEVTNEEFRQLAQWALDQDFIEMTGESTIVLRDKTGAQNFLLTLNADGSELDYDAEGDTLILYDVGFGINPDHPVKYLSWWGAAAYCDWLSIKEGREPAYDHTTWEVDHYNITGYRLPTEAEWEYAARGGTQTAFAGHGINALLCEADSLASQAWYCYNAGDWSRPVGQLLPNNFGLYDMHGNAWEICNDWNTSTYYTTGPSDDPTGPETGLFRVTRGGAWDWAARYARAAQRGAHFVGQTSANEGFRPVLLKSQD